jgi:hypothetical protein
MKRILAVIIATVFWSAVVASTAGCNATTVAQKIVTWTPTAISTAETIATVVSGLAPEDAIIIAGVTAGFVAAANQLDAQAKAYLANPTASVLATLQNQVLTFQQSVNSALLSAARITNPKSQQSVLAKIQALATILNVIIGLLTTVKGNSVMIQARSLGLHLPAVDRQIELAVIEQHYGVSDETASAYISMGHAQLAYAGL